MGHAQTREKRSNNNLELTQFFSDCGYIIENNIYEGPNTDIYTIQSKFNKKTYAAKIFTFLMDKEEMMWSD